MRELHPESEEFLSWLSVERGRAKNTLAAYRRDLFAYEAALAAVGRTPIDALPGDVERHVASLRGRQSPASVARALSCLRGLHRFLLDEGVTQSDPTFDVGAGQLPLRLPKAIDEDLVVRMLDAVSTSDATARRDRSLLEVLYATGARVSELVGLNVTDVTDALGAHGTGLVRLYGKGSKERLVPIGRSAIRSLERWLEPAGRDAMAPKRWQRRSDAEALYLNRRGGRLSRQGVFAIVRARSSAFGAPVGPHAFRHSCATHMLAHGADVRVVQEMLGHVSVTTTQIYTKVTNEHLRAAYEAAHPRAGTSAARGPSKRAPAV